MTLQEAKIILNTQKEQKSGSITEMNFSHDQIKEAQDVVLDAVNKIPEDRAQLWNFLYINAIRGGIGNEGKAELAFRLYCDPEVKGLVDEKVREKIANQTPNPTFAHYTKRNQNDKNY